jgi:hypothetical protein
MLFLLLLLIGSTHAACHPQCTNSCNANQTAANACAPVCAPPRCQYQCTTPGTQCEAYAPVCRVRCPADMCESDSCPLCETVCDQPALLCVEAGCSPLCEATSCSWSCRNNSVTGLPSGCAWVNCETPACAVSGTVGALAGGIGLVVVLLSLVL